MHNATQPTYVLTDEKLKKVAKGVKKRLNEKLPEQHALSQQSILQVLSQELFSMPYEEAKSTVLSGGVNVLSESGGGKVGAIDVSDLIDKSGVKVKFNITDYCIFEESIEMMKWIIPLNEVNELKPYLALIYGEGGYSLISHDGDSNGVNSKPNALQSIDDLSRRWNEDEVLFGCCMMALHYYASQGADTFTLSRMREVLTLEQAIKWTNSASLPADIKLMLARTLHEENVVKNGQVHFDSVIRFERSVRKQAREIDVMYKYINSEDGRERLLSVDGNASVYKDEIAMKTPEPELALLGALTTLTPLIPLHAMADLESIKEQVIRVVNGKDDVVLAIRHQNALRKKEMGSVWYNRSYGLVRAYTDAYLCGVGRTMQTARFFDLVAGFNLDNLAKMSKDKELPFELRSELKAALGGLMYVWDSKEQPVRVTEAFDYIVMQVSEPFNTIKSYILDNIA